MHDLLQSFKQANSGAADIFITAGLELMRRLGPAGLSLNNILTQAGKPRGSFYALFGSKASFEAEVVHSYFQPDSEELVALAGCYALTGREKIEAWSALTVKRLALAEKQGERVTSLTEMSARTSSSLATTGICETHFRERVCALSRILTEAGITTARQAEAEACLLLVMLDGVMTCASITHAPALAEQYFSYLF